MKHFLHPTFSLALLRPLARTCAFVLLASCTPLTTLTPPSVTPDMWQEYSAHSAASEVDQHWWLAFNDPILTELITRAKTQSPDVRIALATLEQARALESGALADQLPISSAGADFSRQRSSRTLSNRVVSKNITNDFRNDFDASWEVNLLGVAPSLRAARHFTATEQALLEGAYVTLAGDIARNYFDVRQAQAQIAVAKRLVDAQKITVNLTKDLSQAGKVSEVDTAQAAALLSSLEASLAPFEAAQSAARYRLETLLGEKPGALQETLKPLATPLALPDDPVLAIPAVVLAARPDIRAAEFQLLYRAALKDVAFAQYFPKLSLSSLLGFESGQNAKLFTTPSRVASLSAGVSLPLFDFGRIRADVAQADAQGKEALAQYEKTVLSALAEIETALNAYYQERKHYADLDTSLRSHRLALALATERYERGLTPYLAVLDSQKSLYEVENTLAQSRAAIFLQLVQLYKALGGGWK